MSFAQFQESVARDSLPPPSASPALQALWHDARGDWEQAHACAQADEGRDAAWVHAYLHRKEGDHGNASYWYRRAGRPVPATDWALNEEWSQITRKLAAAAEADSQ
jgi:hypothetical protein